MKPLFCLTVLCMIAPAASAQTVATTREALVVSADWLRHHIDDPQLVLLHVGARSSYDAGHLPGARYVDYRVDLAANQDASGLTLEMPPPDALHDRLAALGISDGSHAVVYYSDNQWTPSTRVLLTLAYAGLARVSWLDGGQAAWVGAGGALTTAAPPAKRGTLSPLRPQPVVADAAFVAAHLGTAGYAIVDARTREFYDGTRTGGRPPAMHKTGHIAGAVNLPYDSFIAPDGTLKPAAEIASAFAKAGVKPADVVVTYCHIGQQATAVALAARTLGHRVLLYDGSFEDWSRRNLPVDGFAVKH